MELLEDIPVELHNLIYSYLGQHPVAELLKQTLRREMSWLDSDDEPSDSDFEGATRWIRFHERVRVQQSRPSWKLYLAMVDLIDYWRAYIHETKHKIPFVSFACPRQIEMSHIVRIQIQFAKDGVLGRRFERSVYVKYGLEDDSDDDDRGYNRRVLDATWDSHRSNYVNSDDDAEDSD